MIRKLLESIPPVESLRHLIFGIHNYCHGSDFPAVIEGLFEGTHQKEFPDTLSHKIQTPCQTPEQRCWKFFVLRKAEPAHRLLGYAARVNPVLRERVVAGDDLDVRRKHE